MNFRIFLIRYFGSETEKQRMGVRPHVDLNLGSI